MHPPNRPKTASPRSGPRLRLRALFFYFYCSHRTPNFWLKILWRITMPALRTSIHIFRVHRSAGFTLPPNHSRFLSAYIRIITHFLAFVLTTLKLLTSFHVLTI